MKYAVSPQEEGARIDLTAKVQSGRLKVQVSDTGPGLKGPRQGDLLALAKKGGADTSSTGVGLANIRNRLMQAYGENHRFETSSGSGGGFTVSIDIPFETADEPAAETESEPTHSQPAEPAQPSPSVGFRPGRPMESNA